MPRVSSSALATRTVALKAQGAALAAARKTLSITQAEAAERLGVPLWTYRSWEQGHRSCPKDTRAAAAKWAKDPEVRAALAVDNRRCPCCGRPFGPDG